MIPCVLTFDVEDWFQVSAFAPHIPRSEWDTREWRVERNMERILALLQRHGVQATFFTLGCVAQRCPQLVRAIVDAGHELASHGWDHRRVSELTRAEFLADIGRAKALGGMDPAGLAQEIEAAMGSSLGSVEIVDKVQVYPLGLTLARSFAGKRIALERVGIVFEDRSLATPSRVAVSDLSIRACRGVAAPCCTSAGCTLNVAANVSGARFHGHCAASNPVGSRSARHAPAVLLPCG